MGEGDVALCSCDCHQPCPLAGRTAAGFWEWWPACACPGAENMRGAMDRSGADPAVLARKLESFRREMAGDEDARRESAKRALVRGYESAAAQAAGQPVDPDIAMEDPRFAMQLIVNMLARLESDAAVAGRLGLSEAEVAALRESHMEFQAVIARRLIASRPRKRRWRPGRRRLPAATHAPG